MPKSDQLRISVIEETVPGVTPATPNYRRLRVISDSIDEESSSEASGELSGARGVSGEIDGGRSVSGSIESYLVANLDFENFLAALLGGTWSAGSLTPGFTVRTFTIEKSAPIGPASAYRHLRYAGVGINTLQLSAQPQQAIRCTWGVVGGVLDDDTAEIASSVYGAASPSVELAPPMRSAEMDFAWGGGFAGLDPATICHTAATLNLNANAEVRQCLTVPSASEFEPGRLVGDLAVTLLYLQGAFDLYAPWRLGTEGSVVLSFADQTPSPNNHTYSIVIPRLKLRAISTPTPATNTDVVSQATFAILQPTAGAAVTIVRATA